MNIYRSNIRFLYSDVDNNNKSNSCVSSHFYFWSNCSSRTNIFIPLINNKDNLVFVDSIYTYTYNYVRIFTSTYWNIKVDHRVFLSFIPVKYRYSLDCKEGHMKKIRLSVCLFAFGVKRISVLKTHNSDQWLLKLSQILGFQDQGVWIWVQIELKGQKNIDLRSH